MLLQVAYAQKFASWALVKLITAFWNQIASQERYELRSYVLRYLGERGPRLDRIVRIELYSLYCRLTKLGWAGSDEHRNVVDELEGFLKASEEHCIIGLQLFARVVSEMHSTTLDVRRAFAHSQARKVALSFRDLHLLKIFNIALTILERFQQPTNSRIRQYSLKLALACLSFDFVGNGLDETGEDVGTIHIPMSWNTVVTAPKTLQLFLDVYDTTAETYTDQSSSAVECLVQLASVRRTLFKTDEQRLENLRKHVSATLQILRSQRGLTDHSNYHHFCRWLSRLKINYQLDELVGLDLYQNWIDAVSQFTLKTLKSDWRWVGDSLHYVLNLWSRLVAATPYLKSGRQSYLTVFVRKIVETYVSARLMQLSQSPDSDEDEDIREHLEAIPLIFRLDYAKAANYLISIIDPLLLSYKSFAASGGIGADSVEISLLESKLAWLVRVIGAVVSGRLSASSSDAQEITDGELSSRVFQIMVFTIEADKMKRQRTGANGTSTATPTGRARNTPGARSLDNAVVSFTQAFRRSYIGEDSVANSKVYVRMAERLGMTDHMTVLDVVASKLAANLQNYGVVDGQNIIANSLSLLSDLSSGYSSSRLLCKLATIGEMIEKHDEDSFPFMKGPDSQMGRNRTTFYQTLLRILSSSGSAELDMEAQFTRFMEPLGRKLELLHSLQSKEAFLSDPSVKAASVGIMRDLRGVVNAISNRRLYSLFFDWIYPKYVKVILRVCEVYSESGMFEITTPLLKLYADIVHNKASRVIFDSSSPNGILLFRETSKILVTYGRFTLANWERIGGANAVASGTSTIDPYRTLYKGIWVCLLMFARSLSGGYVNFGVFELYGDTALNDAMSICFQMMLVVPINDVMAYPKVAKAYFQFIEILCSNHTKSIVTLEHPAFKYVVRSLQEGLQASEVWLSSQAASSINQLSGFRFKHTMKNTEHGQIMQRHCEQSPELFPQCLEIIFDMILTDDCSNQWSMSRPLLSLILTNEDAFLRLKATTIENQKLPERKAVVTEAFEKLMVNVKPNLDSKNRDRFTQNVTAFRIALRTDPDQKAMR